MTQDATTADILIAGAGIAGASLAARLAGEARVILLEMEDQPGYHATSRSAANYEPTYGPPLIRTLTKASWDFYNAPPDGFAATPLLGPREVLLLGGQDDGTVVEELLTFGYDRIGRDEAVRIMPLLRTPLPEHLLIDRTNRDIDVEAVHRGFLAQHRRTGGALICKARVESAVRRDGAWQVATAAGDFQAPVLVNAAGAWADDVARRAGLGPLGLQPKRRSACVVAGPAGVDIRAWPQLGTVTDTFYTKPMGGKLMVSPMDADPVEPHDAFADDFALAEAIDRYQTFVAHDVTRIERSWGGLRTFASDGDPVVGFDPRIEGFFWNAGQGGYGIQTAPSWSEMAAALVARQALPGRLAALGISAAQVSPGRQLAK